MKQLIDYPSTNNKTHYRSHLTETTFIQISLLFGSLFIFTTPPFQVADESRHFARAYQLSETTLSSFRLIPAQKLLPESLVNAIKQTDYLRSEPGSRSTFYRITQLMKVSLQPAKRVPYDEYAGYSFVSYLPQIIAIIPLRLVEVNAVITLYAARLAALLFWVIMTYWALRLIPLAKPLFFFIALLPMTLFQAGSASSDSVTFALSFLLVALYFRFAYRASCVGTKELLTTAILGVTLTAAKFVYAPLIGLHFLIPSSKFRSQTNYVGSFLLISCLCFLILLAPFNSLFVQAMAMLEGPESTVIGAGLTPYPQLNFLLADPQNVARTATSTFLRFGRSYMNGFVGVLGWYGAMLPSYLYVVAVIVLWLTAFTTTDRFFVSLKQKLLLLLIILITTAAICVGISTDVRENPVPTFQMRGLQGRYFTPFALLIGLLASNQFPFFQRYQRFVKPALLPFILFLLTNAYYCLLIRYYF